MKGILVGAAIGYVLGAKAGRERYDQIVRLWHRFTANPTVRKTAAQAKDKAFEAAVQAKDRATDVAEKAAEKAPWRHQENSDGKVTTSPMTPRK
ncbi:YtxH domain-containing protein [Lentzea albidocapillata]|uniref:YtxH-like protein n=1 Tax=Lentzea albidocapillata TaxID=40571 RepID=A0A1W2F1S2_9PSEU|nr:YtxH domain-containing protein [Lentzea albidocapillata]SMD15762.1 hypothetical protein SAMN05660733_04913 [Lentzea albidocapillata]